MSNKVPFFIVALLVLPAIVVGQIHPPKPGVEMPQAYYDRIADDPTAFQFQRAWIEKTRRAKAARFSHRSKTSGTFPEVEHRTENPCL